MYIYICTNINWPCQVTIARIATVHEIISNMLHFFYMAKQMDFLYLESTSNDLAINVYFDSDLC